MRFQLFKHYSHYTGPWLWPNFKPAELACRHCGELCLDQPSLDALQMLRANWGKPIALNSAHRCAEHNAKVGGVKDSMHLKLAFDCRVAAEEREAFADMAESCGFKGIGIYPAFVHVDMREEAAVWRG